MATFVSFGCPICGGQHRRKPGDVCPRYYAGVKRLRTPKQKKSLPGQQSLFTNFKENHQ
jgi:hypothetical protein